MNLPFFAGLSAGGASLREIPTVGTCPEIRQAPMAFGAIYQEAMLWQVNFS